MLCKVNPADLADISGPAAAVLFGWLIVGGALINARVLRVLARRDLRTGQRSPARTAYYI